MNEKTLTIPSDSGAILAATLYEPNTYADTKTVVIMCHGFTTNQNNFTGQTLTPKLDDLGIASLRFDFFGHGKSTGEFPEITITKGKQDILACVNHARSALGFKTVGLFGSSYGGATSIMAASEIEPPLDALVLKAPVTNYRLRDDEYYSEQEIKQWEEKGYMMVDHSERGEEKLNFVFYEDEENNKGWEAAKKITTPTLIIHGDADKPVPIKDTRHAVTLFPNADLVELEGVDHWFKEEGAFERMITESVDFLSQKLL